MITEKPRILLAEDERELADLYTTWLETDYSVVTTYDGESAIQHVTPDLDAILLDRRMPGISGDDVLTEVRDMGLDCPVAMVTAVEPEFDIIEMGFDDYIQKPIDKAELHALVEELLTLETYDDYIQKFYQLASKKAALKASKAPAELEQNAEYQSLDAELEAIKAETDQALKDMDQGGRFDELL